MNRQTVDYGIDLGTTNSSIARMEKKGPRVIKNRYQSDVTPSAVSVNREGEILVGDDALADHELQPARLFKRLIGTKNALPLKDGSLWTPEQLSAEVLKEMKTAVRRRFDEDLTHAVITVPAMFQQPQCEATLRAAELAGLHAVALLQEPIAAATAYLADESDDGVHLVYDLGGGTFDVSLVQLRDGEMHVVAHGGDNQLGGSDFDQGIYNWALHQLEEGYGRFPDLNRGAAKWSLLSECEQAKIRLTDDEETFIDLSDLQLPVNRIKITRGVLEDLIEEHVSKTITYALHRIKEADLTVEDIHSILLVGGPTQIPYIRQRLKEELGISLRLEDPMTIVALGAAVHASTLLKPDRVSTGPISFRDEAALELHYEPVSTDRRCSASGKVVNPEGFKGEVRFSRKEGDWETGWIRLKNSSFLTELSLGNQMVTEFQISLRDTSGDEVKVTPSAIAIRLGTSPAKPIVPYHYGVALEDSSMSLVIEEGTTLPAYGVEEYRTNRAVHAGSDEEFVIYFLEGHSLVASDNVKVGELRLHGRQLPRTLKESEKVEVRLRMDESRRLTARVYIPILDLETEVELTSIIHDPNTEDLRQSLEEAMDIIRRVEDYVDEEEQKAVLSTARELEGLEADLERVKEGEVGGAERMQQKIALIKQNLRPMDTKYSMQALYDKVRISLERAEEICEQFDDRMGLATVIDLRKDAEKCKRLNDRRGMEAIHDKAITVFMAHYKKTPEFWIGFVQWLRSVTHKASDSVAYLGYVRQAEQCLAQGDIEGTHLNGIAAMRFLPETEEQDNRFWDTILRR